MDSGDRLIDSFTGSIEDIDLSAPVADFVNEDGQWDVERLSELLPVASISAIVGMPPPREDCGEDDWVWGGESNGSFSIKSAYSIVCRFAPSSSHDMWSQIWSWKGPNRIRCFLWLAIQDKLLTNCSRVRRHLAGDAACSLCQHPEESAAHVLRDCRFAEEAWIKLGGFDVSSALWRGEFVTWMRHNLKSADSLVFGVMCWMLWKTRNGRIFTAARSSAASVAFQAANWSRQVNLAMTKEDFTTCSRFNRRTIEVRWEPGPEGWVTLNSDGSVDQQARKASAGGVLRNSEGKCLLAFSMNLGSCSITRAEMRGAIEGLKRTWNAGFRRVVLKMDSKAAISLLTSADMSTHQHSMEKMEFQELIRRDWEIQVEHTFREGNQTADFLATLGYGYPFGSHTVLSSDSRLGYFLRLDCLGIAQPRSVLIND
ncbi:Putative ribonuclease H protein At1g65750 [Linum perenne]